MTAVASSPVRKGGLHAGEVRENRGLPVMGLTALGVVFGDLGTSPLYTLQTILQTTGGHVDRAAALGVLSLIFWTLLLTVSVKYCLFVMRADNHGEGGILALMSLVGANRWGRGAYIGAAMGLLGAALIYGDGVITPSISVLSAIEGVNVATSALKPFILPVAVAILLGLFSVQRFGTSSIGRAFGPVMLVWFAVIGVLGLVQLLQRPDVLWAVNPLYGVQFLIHRGPTALLVLGAVFLCCTGGEALYADMGHVGRGPIRLSWYALVLPALLLSYAGQTAAILGKGGAGGANPFFMIAPGWALYPLVGLATLATIIASQAIITGSFSMTRQAMQLGWLPLFNVRQTSQESYGQIYLPVVNWIMAAATLAITLTFRSSDKLAGAYGMAVSTTMLLTTCLLFQAMSKVWRWPAALVWTATGLFLLVDGGFFVANLLKLVDGGWIPLTLGALIFVVMITWRQGVQSVRDRLVSDAEPIDAFVKGLETRSVARTPGVAAFLTRLGDRTPPLMSEYVRLTGSLQQTVVALSLSFEEVPRVAPERRADFSMLSQDFWRVNLRYGFMENPDLAAGLSELEGFDRKVDLSQALFFGTRDYVTCGKEHGMSAWRTGLFAFLYRNGVRITDRFNLPARRTIEIAREIEI
jgi:KUP system potassium uptake protein